MTCELLCSIIVVSYTKITIQGSIYTTESLEDSNVKWRPAQRGKYWHDMVCFPRTNQKPSVSVVDEMKTRDKGMTVKTVAV